MSATGALILSAPDRARSKVSKRSVSRSLRCPPLSLPMAMVRWGLLNARRGGRAPTSLVGAAFPTSAAALPLVAGLPLVLSGDEAGWEPVALGPPAGR